jgi:hypothetical protein
VCPPEPDGRDIKVVINSFRSLELSDKMFD